MFDPGDAAGLARAVEAAMSDDAWREQARRLNRAVVEERGDWTRNMAEVEKVFESLAGGGRR
jgi:UDP:flavonoid glycosyltransferase YjiC (YdhE family)